jgi:hypothetical protein
MQLDLSYDKIRSAKPIKIVILPYFLYKTLRKSLDLNLVQEILS